MKQWAELKLENTRLLLRVQALEMRAQ